MSNLQGINKKKIIDVVLKNIEKISKAPTPPEWAKESGSSFEKWQKAELKNQYKCVDEDGNVYLTRNPHCWKHEKRQVISGLNEDGSERIVEYEVKVKFKPKLIMNYKEAQKQVSEERQSYGNNWGGDEI